MLALTSGTFPVKASAALSPSVNVATLILLVSIACCSTPPVRSRLRHTSTVASSGCQRNAGDPERFMRSPYLLPDLDGFLPQHCDSVAIDLVLRDSALHFTRTAAIVCQKVCSAIFSQTGSA